MHIKEKYFFFPSKETKTPKSFFIKKLFAPKFFFVKKLFIHLQS